MREREPNSMEFATSRRSVASAGSAMKICEKSSIAELASVETVSNFRQAGRKGGSLESRSIARACWSARSWRPLSDSIALETGNVGPGRLLDKIGKKFREFQGKLAGVSGQPKMRNE